MTDMIELSHGTGGIFNAPFRPELMRVWSVMNRSSEISALDELYNGLDQPKRRPGLSGNTRIAFGFDTNAIYRIGLNGTRGDNAVDYLRQNKGPVIIPGQVIQETWNNALSGVQPKASKVRKKLEELRQEMAGIGQHTGELGERVQDALEDFTRLHGQWIDPDSAKNFDRTLSVLRDVAATSYVPRLQFYQLAKVRKETKTPPGFKDDASNYGDFFVWADFLYGLAKVEPTDIDAVVMVTNDKKPDWSRGGVAHPLLVAEAVSISGVPFRLWDLNDFEAHATKILNG
ncbi:PIN-like domain-containing protein [Nocardia sp. NPDC059691]|uniref:PIN-like domain-containing protein n=1 Tax=Nocardia sp. NPDC059691 TaxID=3346908 RepID=UPI00367AF2DF